MDAVINLKHEPKLREAFEYAHVHNNTVLIDRRTKWGNPFRIGRDGTRDEVIARYRADLWHRIRAGETALEELAQIGTRRLLARLPSLRSAALSRPCARTRSGMGLRGPGGAGRWVSGKWVCLRVAMAFMAMPSARAIRCNLRSLRSLRFPLSIPIASSRWRSLRAALATKAATSAHRLQAPCRTQPPKGAVPGTNKYSSDVIVHRATRAHCANPASGGVLHSAALRCGRDSE